MPLRSPNGCRIAFSSLLCHFRQSHTQLPAALKQIAVKRAVEAAKDGLKQGLLSKGQRTEQGTEAAGGATRPSKKRASRRSMGQAEVVGDQPLQA